MERLVDYDKFIKDYGVLSNHEDDYRLLCAAKITAYTKDEVIAKLQDIRARAWMHHSKFDDDRDFEVDKAVEDIVWLIDTEINSLKESENDIKEKER